VSVAEHMSHKLADFPSLNSRNRIPLSLIVIAVWFTQTDAATLKKSGVIKHEKIKTLRQKSGPNLSPCVY
jgi:hypothetical protein